MAQQREPNGKETNIHRGSVLCCRGLETVLSLRSFPLPCRPAPVVAVSAPAKPTPLDEPEVASLRYENERLTKALEASNANKTKWESELTTLRNTNVRLTTALQDSAKNVEQWKTQVCGMDLGGDRAFVSASLRLLDVYICPFSFASLVFRSYLPSASFFPPMPFP